MSGLTMVELQRELRRITDKEYNQTPAGIKRHITYNWTNAHGITFGNMSKSEFYDNVFMPALNCWSCNKEFNKKDRNDYKATDHLHKIIPLNVRGIICHACNIHDNWRYRMTDDSIYQLYLKEHNDNEKVKNIFFILKNRTYITP